MTRGRRDTQRFLLRLIRRTSYNSFVSRLKRAEKLNRTPLQQVFILIGLFQVIAEQIVEPGADFLMASYVYQCEGIDQEIRDITVQNKLRWRQRLGDKFEEVIAKYPLRFPVMGNG